MAGYRTWISTFAASIGTRPAVVVIEPDALGDFNCMSDAAIQERARQALRARPGDVLWVREQARITRLRFSEGA